MKLSKPDVLVLGLGAMGSAALLHLARLGLRVVGIDRYAPPHAQGSSHGETRITRQAIGEGAHFVPLALRSQQLWREHERETGLSLFSACGALVVSRKGLASRMHAQDDFLGNTLRAAQQYGIAHECLSADAISRRFPQLTLVGDEQAYYEPGGGFLRPERCITAQLQLAVRDGATLVRDAAARLAGSADGRACVEAGDARYLPGTLVIAAGAWMPQLVPALAPRLKITRQELHWFALDGNARYDPGQFPVFIWHWGAGADDVFYGFPQLDGEATIKTAAESDGEPIRADDIDRRIDPVRAAALHARHIAPRLKGVTSTATRSATCLYSSTANANFIIDRVPQAADTLVISACSGHGFKHSAAIGEAVAAMVHSGSRPAILEPFTWPAG